MTTIKIPYQVMDGDDERIAVGVCELDEATIIDELGDVKDEGSETLKSHIDAFIHDRVIEDFERTFGPEVEEQAEDVAIAAIEAVLARAPAKERAE